MFYEVEIKPCPSGFGEYQASQPFGDGWECMADMIAEMQEWTPGIEVVGTSDCAVDDIRVRIHNEPGIVLGWLDTDGWGEPFPHYCGIVERERGE